MVVGLLIIVITVAALAPRGDAHYRYRPAAGDDKKRWFFRGYTARNSDGSVRSDPINIFFYRGGRITGDRVSNHIGQHAGLTDRYKFVPGHLPSPFVNCSNGSNQYLTFLNYTSARVAGAPAKDTDFRDRGKATGCDTRFHLRFWDDLEHEEAMPENAHRAKDWGPANVHREIRRGVEHDVISWEFAERWLLRKMRNHCQKRDWRVLPGSTGRKGSFRGLPSDGRVSLITMAHC